MPWALALALASAGKSNAARMAIIAITTRSSMSVKARAGRGQGPVSVCWSLGAADIKVCTVVHSVTVRNHSKIVEACECVQCERRNQFYSERSASYQFAIVPSHHRECTDVCCSLIDIDQSWPDCFIEDLERSK